MRATTIAAVASILALGACASSPDIRFDKNPEFNVSGYKTFGFYEPVSTDTSRYTTLISGHLKSATRKELEKRNYVYSTTNPQLRVNFVLRVTDRQELRSSPGHIGPFGRTWASDIDTVNYKQGTLGIELVDSGKKELVWQSVAEGRLSRKAIENPGATVDTLVSEMFATFPLNHSDGQLASLTLDSIR